jgi:hypothetical protein
MSHRRAVRLCVFVLLTCLVTLTTKGQSPAWSVRVGGGLGVSVISMPRLADYANAVGSPAPADRVDEFQTAGELVVMGDLHITDEWSAGFVWGRSAQTIETVPSSPGSGWVFDVTMVMPTIVVRRSVEIGTIDVQASFGGGPYSGELVQRYGPLGTEQRFTGSGLGLMAGLSTWAALDDHVAAGISADVRWSGVSRLTDEAGREPAYRTSTATMRWMQLTLQFLIVAQF